MALPERPLSAIDTTGGRVLLGDVTRVKHPRAVVGPPRLVVPGGCFVEDGQHDVGHVLYPVARDQ